MVALPVVVHIFKGKKKQPNKQKSLALKVEYWRIKLSGHDIRMSLCDDSLRQNIMRLNPSL